MKTSLPLCTLVLIAVRLTMVHGLCYSWKNTTCMVGLRMGAVGTILSEDADTFCKVYNTYKGCMEAAQCPINEDAIFKEYGFNCNHASRLVSAQAMPVLILFIIGLFFGVF